MASSPSLLFAFGAGLVSFLSPCMLPVVPAFISHMAGTNLDSDVSRRRLFLTAAMFVAGFSLVFGVLGVLLNSVLEGVGNTVLSYLSLVAGTVIVVFGVHLSGIVDFSFFERSFGGGLDTDIGTGYLSSLLLGGAFAVGWTPCVGPILGSIFLLASTSPGSSFVLLSAYSLGLGTPFLLVGLFPERFMAKVRGRMDLVARVRTVFGYLMIVLGLLIMTQNLSLVASVGVLSEVFL